MFTVLSFMLFGIAVGFLLRSWKLRSIHLVIKTVIWLLLFLLGLEVGANKTVTNQFGKLGYEALILATSATLGSVIFAGLLWLVVSNKKNTQ